MIDINNYFVKFYFYKLYLVFNRNKLWIIRHEIYEYCPLAGYTHNILYTLIKKKKSQT